MDQEQAALAAVTPSPTSASKRWPGASVWPSWDLLEAPKDPFSIEREARLHRQAAGKCVRGRAWGPRPHPWSRVSGCSSQTAELSRRGLGCMVRSLGLFCGRSAMGLSREDGGGLLVPRADPVRGWRHLTVLLPGDWSFIGVPFASHEWASSRETLKGVPRILSAYPFLIQRQSLLALSYWQTWVHSDGWSICQPLR